VAPTDLPRCSIASLDRGDPLAGTAPVATRWLLVEHLGPWAKKPMDTEPLLGPVGVEVEATAASVGGKVLLVRRPGRRIPGAEEHHWFAVDTVRRTWVRGTWRTPTDLLDAARALGARLSASDEDAGPMVLVCTHGTRDTCCAVRGRPIVASLARALPEQVWECTHLGGHRFAGTLLSLPDGACFGRLDPDTAVEVVHAHRQGRTDPSHLRGTTRWVPAVQDAVVAARTNMNEVCMSLNTVNSLSTSAPRALRWTSSAFALRATADRLPKRRDGAGRSRFACRARNRSAPTRRSHE